MTEDLARQFVAMGGMIPPGLIPVPVMETFDVMPANWPALCAFIASATQWRALAGAAGIVWLGLDYAAVDVVLRRTGADDAVFADLQLMEAAALKAFGEAQP